ncbi:MAG: hypothetical protein JNL24_01575 [Bacteroidia bacterium]|nr:hypothetical protein [Bacteroidia bacterium]
MRKTIITLITSLTSLTLWSQNGTKNEFKLECYSPIMTPSMRQYFNDEWILTPSNNYSRKYYSIGFSASYSRQIKEIKIGYRFGLVLRKGEESNNYDYYSGNIYYVDEVFKYSQKHYLNSLYLSHEEELNKISIHFTFEIPFIYYGQGTNNYYNRTYSNNNTTNEILTDYTIIDKQKIGSGYSTGFGLNIGLAFNITNSMKIGVDLCDYLLYTSFKKTSEIYHYEKSTTYFNSPPYEQTEESISTVINNYSQISFSRLVPRLYYSIKL